MNVNIYSESESYCRVPTKLAESAVDAFASIGMHDELDQLNEILAEPAEQRQGEPIGYVWGEPIGYVCGSALDAALNGRIGAESIAIRKTPTLYINKPLYTHADPGEVERLIAECWAACGGKGPATRAELLSALKLMDEADDEAEATINTLRAQLETITKNRDELCRAQHRTAEHLEEAHAQLAERDALLREASAAIKQGDVDFDAVYSSCRNWDELVKDGVGNKVALKIDAALSASAEPSAPVERDEVSLNAERYLFLRNQAAQAEISNERRLSVEVNDWAKNLNPNARFNMWSSLELTGEKLDAEVDKARAAMEGKP